MDYFSIPLANFRHFSYSDLSTILFSFRVHENQRAFLQERMSSVIVIESLIIRYKNAKTFLFYFHIFYR